MKTQTLIITSLLLTILVGTMFVYAGDLLGLDFSKDVSISKDKLDFLLGGDSKAGEGINPQITITCGETTCEWSAYYPDVISSYDNVIDKCYSNCNKFGFNKTTEKQECEEWETICYTTQEIENKVISIVTEMISEYAGDGLDELSKGEEVIIKGEVVITAK